VATTRVDRGDERALGSEPDRAAGADLDLPDGGLLGAIVRLNLAVTGVLEDHAGRSGLTFADYLVLGVVRRSPDQRSAPTAIATTLDRTTGGLTLTLDRLEVAGLVRRTRHTGDGRRVIIELTPKGRRIATAVNASLHEWEAALDLPVPVAAAVSLLDDLTAAIAPAPGAPSGSTGR
jgi:DNA-binding MarR family transcriptional regulator